VGSDKEKNRENNRKFYTEQSTSKETMIGFQMRLHWKQETDDFEELTKIIKNQ